MPGYARCVDGCHGGGGGCGCWRFDLIGALPGRIKNILKKKTTVISILTNNFITKNCDWGYQNVEWMMLLCLSPWSLHSCTRISTNFQGREGQSEESRLFHPGITSALFPGFSPFNWEWREKRKALGTRHKGCSPYHPGRFQVAFLEYIGGRWSSLPFLTRYYLSRHARIL